MSELANAMNAQGAEIQTHGAQIDEIRLDQLLEIHAKKINGIFSQFRLNPLATFCQKTGQPVSTMARESLLRALQTHGETKLAEILFLASGAAVDPVWVHTDEIALDKLAAIDPKGFAIYALNLLCHIRDFEKTGKPSRAKSWETVSVAAEKHFALARAWQAINFLPLVELDKLNDYLVHVLIYAPETVRYIANAKDRNGNPFLPVLSPDLMVMQALEYKLIPELQNAINSGLGEIASFQAALAQKAPQIRREMFEEKSRTIKHAAHGPTQIRRMEKAKSKIRDDEKRERFAKMSQLFDDLLGDETLPGNETWRNQKLWENKHIKTLHGRIRAVSDQPIPQTESMKVFDNLLSEETETDDASGTDETETVEIRRMSREEFAKMEEERYLEKIRAEMNSRPAISFRERIAQTTKPEIAQVKPTQSLRDRILNKGKN